MTDRQKQKGEEGTLGFITGQCLHLSLMSVKILTRLLRPNRIPSSGPLYSLESPIPLWVAWAKSMRRISMGGRWFLFLCCLPFDLDAASVSHRLTCSREAFPPDVLVTSWMYVECVTLMAVMQESLGDHLCWGKLEPSPCCSGHRDNLVVSKDSLFLSVL